MNKDMSSLSVWLSPTSDLDCESDELHTGGAKYQVIQALLSTTLVTKSSAQGPSDSQAFLSEELALTLLFHCVFYKKVNKEKL